ncbi:CLUMA_CG013323, isoform A [Clunio marinus]|uniref:CLUMA_CG013323, isoform A n=1 Tax=Clunio marinus TaxID=568069 RepID=A0A1J1IIJ2_9DIPT|nr:CLUMA_CG013323, isoform A [Clunio marinus]
MDSQTVDKLATGLLNEFISLNKLEVKLSKLLDKQNDMLNHKLDDLKSIYIQHSDEEIAEVSFMMKKIAIYRTKVKNLRSDMLYICQRVAELKKKSIEIQTLKVEQKAERVKRCDYEVGLIPKKKPENVNK